MRLWYQSLTRSDLFNSYEAFLRSLVVESVPADVQVDVYGVPRPGGYADHQYRYWEMVDARDVVSNAIRAQAMGYDAYLVGNILDPGLHVAREVVDIPVLGLCDSAITAACQMGRTYGFVTISEQQSYRIERNVDDHGTRSRFRGCVTLGIDDYPSIDANYNDAKLREFIDRFSQLASQLGDDGVEVVIPGGGVVMGLLARAALTRAGSVPIVDGIRSLLGFGVAAATTWIRQGHFTSKRLAYAGPTPPGLDDIRASYGANMAEGPLGMPKP